MILLLYWVLNRDKNVAYFNPAHIHPYWSWSKHDWWKECTLWFSEYVKSLKLIFQLSHIALFKTSVYRKAAWHWQTHQSGATLSLSPARQGFWHPGPLMPHYLLPKLNWKIVNFMAPTPDWPTYTLPDRTESAPKWNQFQTQHKALKWNGHFMQCDNQGYN